ncbi:ferredoxin [Ktedonobacter sp. SOSP1-52]|uniref:4Fe-4S dicluster domain-containing protein n=1 Tax=Ktedonobacter sp. SOSP1-52 TaxID=2778366 RepID=UPI00191531F0|nr:4Fe-4S dicluster domain-containing protein [Ktedonobacter sp. SOSP1-52]GHO67255.1 ferredoxin [Ktedonobacter sp. SOSP1-52]
MAVETTPNTTQVQPTVAKRRSGAPVLLNMFKLLHKETPPPQQATMGFFTDTSICIGCKACEVACRQWNQLTPPPAQWSGSSYDNTTHLGAHTWRHVQFIEQIDRVAPPSNGHAGRPVPELPLFEVQTLEDKIAAAKFEGILPEAPPGTALPFFNNERWLMRSDVCKHCANAPCQEACPTGAIIRTEFDTVYVQQDICNGCGYCTVACPFGVIARDDGGSHTAHKCTLCYDRLKDDMEPACAKACPTDSITFGEVEQLKERARERLGFLQKHGVKEALLYGVDDQILDGGLNSFFLLLEEPEVYNLPRNPARPMNNVPVASLWSILAALVLGLASMLFFQQRDER